MWAAVLRSTLTWMELGRTIVIRRTMLEMGRRELAEAAGISYTYLSELETGVKGPSQGMLTSLAGALRFSSPSALFAWGAALQAFEEEHRPR